jgi:hypothetical protein
MQVYCDKSATAPDASPNALGLPWLNHSANIQVKRRGRGCNLCDQHRHTGTTIGGRVRYLR